MNKSEHDALLLDLADAERGLSAVDQECDFMGAG